VKLELIHSFDAFTFEFARVSLSMQSMPVADSFGFGKARLRGGLLGDTCSRKVCSLREFGLCPQRSLYHIESLLSVSDLQLQAHAEVHQFLYRVELH